MFKNNIKEKSLVILYKKVIKEKRILIVLIKA